MSKTLLERVAQAPVELRPPVESHRRIGPTIWSVIVLALLALVGAVVGLFVLSGGEPEPIEVVPQAVEAVQADVLTCQLAAQGQIPSAACSWEAYWTAKLEAQGLVPSGSHDTLYTREELETLRLAREGQLPQAVLRSETLLTKRFVNEGQIPPAAAD